MREGKRYKGLLVYKSVFFRKVLGGEGLRLKENVQKWIKTSMNDPIVKILAKNSNLTKTQLETLLIDALAENIAGKQLKYDQKARLRLTKPSVTRGAFNRTLKQAKKNVAQAIYTILLLGYLGIFEHTSLDPYLEVANKLQTYLQAYKDLLQKEKGKNEHLRFISMLREELEETLQQLSRP